MSLNAIRYLPDGHVLPVDLPVRPTLQPDEWFESHVVDTARANGIARPWQYHLRTVREAILASPGTGVGDTTKYLKWDNVGRPCYGGRSLPVGSSSGRAGFIKYCPMCMVERPYVRTRWRISHYQVCVDHGCLMKDDLLEPAYRAIYKRSDRGHYGLVSREALLSAATSPLADVIQFHRVLWLPFDELDRAGLGDQEEAAIALAWAILCQRLVDVTMGDARGSQPHVDPLEAVVRRVAWMKQQGLEITPSENGVKDFLSRLSSTRVRQNARRYLQRVLQHEEKSPSVMSLIPVESLLAWLQCSAPEILQWQKPWSNMLSKAQDDSISCRQASVELGMREPRLLWLAQRGWIQPTYTESQGRRNFKLFSRTAVRELKRRLQTLVAVDALVGHRGLSWAAYFSLRSGGWLNPVVIGDERYVHKSELFALLTRLEDVAKPVDCAKRPLTSLFSNEVFNGVPHKVTADLIGTLLSGHIDLYRDLSQTGFSAFLIPDTVFVIRDRLIRAKWHRENVFVNPHQMQLLECA